MTAPERYVDMRELATLMGVSTRTIKRMTAAGMPSETWGMARTRRYLPSQAIEWARSLRKMEGDNNQARRRDNVDGHNQRRE